MAVPSQDWPAFSAINIPGITATVAEMLEALQEIGGLATRDRVTIDPDPAIEAIVASWPARFDTSLAERLGFHAAESAIKDIVARYAATL